MIQRKARKGKRKTKNTKLPLICHVCSEYDVRGTAMFMNIKCYVRRNEEWWL